MAAGNRGQAIFPLETAAAKIRVTGRKVNLTPISRFLDLLRS